MFHWILWLLIVSARRTGAHKVLSGVDICDVFKDKNESQCSKCNAGSECELDDFHPATAMVFANINKSTASYFPLTSNASRNLRYSISMTSNVQVEEGTSVVLFENMSVVNFDATSRTRQGTFACESGCTVFRNVSIGSLSTLSDNVEFGSGSAKFVAVLLSLSPGPNFTFKKDIFANFKITKMDIGSVFDPRRVPVKFTKDCLKGATIDELNLQAYTEGQPTLGNILPRQVKKFSSIYASFAVDELAFSGLNDVQWIQIRRNQQIRHLNCSAFNNIPSNTTIIFDSCPSLSHLSPFTGDGLPHSFEVTYANLTTLPRHFVTKTVRRGSYSFSFEGNAFHCDCELFRTVTEISEKGVFLNGQYATPERLKSTLLWLLKKSDVCKRPITTTTTTNTTSTTATATTQTATTPNTTHKDTTTQKTEATGSSTPETTTRKAAGREEVTVTVLLLALFTQ